MQSNVKETEKYLEFVLKTAKMVFTRDDIKPETRFKEDLNAKSISSAQLMNAVEDEYDMEVPYMEFKRKETVAEAAEYIRQLDN
jgi:acyl carrier protein